MGDMNRRMAAGTLGATDPGVSGVVVTGSAQTFDPPGRMVILSTAGTITGRLLEDTADVAYVLPAGAFPLAFKSIASVSGAVAVVIL